MIEIPITGKPEAKALKLNQQQRGYLAQLVQTPGYTVLMQMFEADCYLQDAAVLAADPANEKEIAAQQHIAVAKWDMLAETQKRIQNEVNEYFAGQRTPPQTSDAEEILSAVART